MSEQQIAEFLYMKFREGLSGRSLDKNVKPVKGMRIYYRWNNSEIYEVVYVSKDKKGILAKREKGDEYIGITIFPPDEDEHNVLIKEYPEKHLTPFDKLSDEDKHYWLEYARQINEENYDA